MPAYMIGRVETKASVLSLLSLRTWKQHKPGINHQNIKQQKPCVRAQALHVS